MSKLTDWLRRNWENVLLAFIGAALFGGIAAVVGIVQEVNLNEKLSLWVGLAILIVAGGIGAAAAFLTTRQYFRSQLRTADVERRRAELERVQAERQLESVRPDFEALKRLGVYTDHFQNVMESALAGDFGFVGFPQHRDPRIKAAFCEMPHEHIATAAGQDVLFSIWAEAKRRLKRDHFEIVFAPNHKQHEVEQFEVGIANTWLRHASDHLANHPEATRLHRIDDLRIAGLFGDDVDVFRNLGYRSLRALAFEVGGGIFRLVALARNERAFSAVEDRYMLLLWVALTVAGSRSLTAATNSD